MNHYDIMGAIKHNQSRIKEYVELKTRFDKTSEEGKGQRAILNQLIAEATLRLVVLYRKERAHL